MPTAASSYDTDLHLAKSCLSGDNESVTTLQSLYAQRLLGLLITRGATNTEATDLLADLWGECTVNRGEREPLLTKYHGKCSLYTWLATVATHRLVDLKRRQRFHGNLPTNPEQTDTSAAFDQLPAPPEKHSESELNLLMRDALKSAMAECPPDALVLLQLVYLHGIMQREAARIFGWHESKVSRLLDSAMADISSRTLRHIRQADPWLEVTWDDFIQLCHSAQDVFNFRIKS